MKFKRVMAVTLSTVALMVYTLSANAATLSLTKTCPVGGCGQSNVANSGILARHCRDYFCGSSVRQYVCSRCGAVYYVCDRGDYQ